MTVGLALSKIIPPGFASDIGDVILIAIGLWFIKDFIIKEQIHKKKPVQGGPINRCAEILDQPEKADADSSGRIDLRETFLLAAALTINNLGLGIGASIAGFNIPQTVAFTFVFSLAFLRIGCIMGKSLLSNFFGKYASLIAGIIIAALGIYELLA
jgi:putative sporulation protein YtaF